jgi:predicted 2-oxoglutarate/Fe(II)-dependent dioxygenase YbiX
MNEIFPSIWIYGQTFQNPQLVIDSLEKAIDENILLNWLYASTGNGQTDGSIKNSYRSNKTISMPTDINTVDGSENLDTFIFNQLTELTNEYANNFGLGPMKDEGYSVLKYTEGTEYKQHYDCGGEHKERVVSMLLYLNDDYEGGELEFPFFGIKYKPSAGDIIFFPSDYAFSHIAHPVTSGIKYALVTWLAYE